MTDTPRCDRIDCIAEARWMPVLRLRVRKGGPAVAAQIGLRICDEHRRTSTLDDVMGDAGWKQLVDNITAQGLVAPKREHTELTFEKVTTT